MAEKKEAFPLSWPSDWPRTSIKDQRANQQWRKSLEYYRLQVSEELKRMNAPQWIISTHIKPDFQGKLSESVARAVRDCGVAVYFDRPHVEDFKWMNTLMLTGVPTEDDIDAQWRKLALPHHPDRGGDLAVFQAFTAAREDGRKWARRLSQPPSLVIACDTFNDVRLNLAAMLKQPIHFNAEQMGLADIRVSEVLIYVGETEESMREDLASRGLLDGAIVIEENHKPS